MRRIVGQAGGNPRVTPRGRRGFFGSSGMIRVRSILCSSLVLCFGARAQLAPISEAEALNPPTSQRLTAVHAAAQRDGWAPQSAILRGAALRAYEREKLLAANSWLNAYRWSALFGQTEAEFVPR